MGEEASLGFARSPCRRSAVHRKQRRRDSGELGGDGGILVPPGDPEALAGAMRKMLDPEIRRHYAEKAPAIAQRFSIERCAEQYAQVYEELLGKRSQGL